MTASPFEVDFNLLWFGAYVQRAQKATCTQMSKEEESGDHEGTLPRISLSATNFPFLFPLADRA